MYEWANEMNCAITVCDTKGIILYMNEKACRTFAKHGDLIGKNLFDCHNPQSQAKIRELLETGEVNAYTIEKNGVKKMIYQTAWKQDGVVGGLVEISMEIPGEMPHYMDFELMLELEDEVRYRLVDSEETRKKYPFPFCLEIGYRIEGKKIEVLWKVINTGTREMHFQIGAHPAFYYPDYDAETTDRGYFGFDKTEGLHYILISEKGCAAPDKEYLLELTDGLLPLDIHSFDKDALILENSQVKEVTLYNKEKKPYLSLYFDTPVVGLWSPPAKNAPFVCIEPWYGRCDRAHYKGEYKDKDWMQHLAPGGVFKGGYTIDIR